MGDSYHSILERADRHFSAVLEAQPQNLSCRRGCTMCCHGLFEIGAADVSVIMEGLRALPDSRRATLVKRAKETMRLTDHPDIRELSDGEKVAFFEKTSAVACPALGSNGACEIYTSRPLVCRTFGLPVREGETYLGQECELNFTAAAATEKVAAAWDLLWEDVLGPEDQLTVPEAIVLADRIEGEKG